MKVGKKELYLLLALLGIIIAICAWQFGFNKMNEKTQGLESETAVLQAEIQKYSAIKNNIELYQKGIEDATYDIAEILSLFPTNILVEDVIMLGREFEKNDDDTYIASINSGNASNIYIATSQPVDSNSIPVTYGLYQNGVNTSFTTTYKGFKEMVDYLYQHENRMSLDAFALSYDSTNGNLSGSMTLNMYYVTGTDKEYVPQNINGISLGTDNIFGTLK